MNFDLAAMLEGCPLPAVSRKLVAVTFLRPTKSIQSCRRRCCELFGASSPETDNCSWRVPLPWSVVPVQSKLPDARGPGEQMRKLLMSALVFGVSACGEQAAEGPAGLPEEMQREHMALIEPLAPDAHRPINFGLYHVFVEPRAERGRPFCTTLDSADAWRSVMQPAATGSSQLFEPPEAMWREHAVLLLAHFVEADPTQNLRIEGIRRTDDVLEVSYQISEPAPSGGEFNWPIAVAVAKPLPPTIRFIENGQVVCETASTRN